MDHIAALKEAIGRPDAVVTDPDILVSACTDWRGWYGGRALALLRPKDVSEVQRAVAACARLRIPLVPQGGNSSLAGASTPSPDGSNVVLSLQHLNRIRAIDASSWSMNVDAGVPLSAVQQAAAMHDRHFGVDLGARDTARVGGLISTNAGGMSVLRYGSMREQVLGLEVVLPDGSVWNGLRGLRKDNSGVDLKHLFIGAEGTLGVITAATLRLHPPERHSATLLLAVKDLDVISTIVDALLETGQVSALELMPTWAVELACREILRCRPPLETGAEWLIQAKLAGRRPVMEQAEEVAASLIENGSVLDAILADGAKQETLWAIRDEFAPVHKWLGHSARFDLSVPLGRIPELIRKLEAAILPIDRELRHFSFGHLGDGNLHFSVFRRLDANDGLALPEEAIDAAVNQTVWSMGGSISAEHGVGLLHRDQLVGQKPAEELRLQKRIKALLDPQDLFNPGKVFIPGTRDA